MLHHITQAHIIGPDKVFDADIRVENGRITALEHPGSLPHAEGATTTDASGLYILPGGIDPHVHLALPTPAGPSADDFESGSRTALTGGVTHIIDFVTPRRGQPLTEALTERHKEAENCSIGLDFHMGISGWLPDMERQMEI
ncbi:MAG: amidohydrolase family protein, partial [Bacteroidales bacterium]